MRTSLTETLSVSPHIGAVTKLPHTGIHADHRLRSFLPANIFEEDLNFGRKTFYGIKSVQDRAKL